MQAVLRNEFFTLTVDTLGAEAVSLKNAAGEEVLWQADPEVWPRHAPILFPWTGELPQSSYSHKGKTYHVVKQGFARDVEHTLVRVDEHEIVMELRSSPELKETWFPFEFVLTSMFRLEGKTIHHTLTVENPGQEELRFGIGFHPAFNIPFDVAIPQRTMNSGSTSRRAPLSSMRGPMVCSAGGAITSGRTRKRSS